MSKRILIVSFLILSISSFICYSNSLHNPFIWDDDAMIVKNPLIRDWRNWSETFSKDLYFGVSSGSNFYRPIQTLSNIWDYHIWQWDPFGYHLTNIVLQILASFLVLLFVHSLTGKIAISFSSALLFALSPLHTEAVTYISGRADLLMGIFLLTAFLLFKKSQNSSGSNKPIFLSLSLIFFTLGLLSKELAVVFPLVILSFIFYYRRGDFRKPAYLIKSVLPFIIIDCLYGILRLTSLKFLTLRPPELTKYPFLIRMTLFPKVIFTYIKMFILPINLHMSYTLVRPVSFIELFIACFLLQIMILGCIYILVYKRDKKIVPFMLSWFLVFLLPQSGIFPINAFVSEHFIYLSSISFFMLLAYLLYRFLRKELFIFSIIGLSSFYGIQTFARNFEWQNPVVFYEKIIKFSPDSVQAHNNLGLQYEYRHLYNQAIREYKKALEIMPNLLEAHSNLANLYFKMGNLEEAKREYAIVEKTAPGSKIGEIQNNIGCIYETEGLWDEALDKYRYALRLDPSLNFTHFNIARIYYEKGDINAACQEILKSLPEISLPLDLQEPYIKIITEYLRSVKHGTPAAIFYNDLGVKFAQDNLFDAADPCFRRVLELEPRYADAHFNLGLIYWKKGLRKDAIYELNAALRINPNHLLAKGLLSEIYKK